MCSVLGLSGLKGRRPVRHPSYEMLVKCALVASTKNRKVNMKITLHIEDIAWGVVIFALLLVVI